MADIKIAKTALKPAVSSLSSGSTAKAGPSAFDRVQAKIADKVAADLKIPPPVQPKPQQIASMETDLRNRLDRTKPQSAGELFRPEVDQSKAALDKLTTAVNKLPPKGAFDPVRERLKVIEQQFQKSSSLIRAGKEMDPKSLLNVQMQLYQVSENIELLSKVVDQLTSGVKTIMQTQV
jgi:hypothetical protein